MSAVRLRLAEEAQHGAQVYPSPAAARYGCSAPGGRQSGRQGDCYTGEETTDTGHGTRDQVVILQVRDRRLFRDLSDVYRLQRDNHLDEEAKITGCH